MGKRRSQIVFFDLETTGLSSRHADILQLAAVYKSKRFNVYLKPEVDINPAAYNVHGISYEDGAMFKDGVAVPAASQRAGLTAFVNFLRQNCGGKPVILCGHNAHKFDAKILTRALTRHGVGVNGAILGYGDSLPLARACDSLPGHKLDDLMGYYLSRAQSETHDALEDAASLKKVVFAMAKSLRPKRYLVPYVRTTLIEFGRFL